MIDSHDKGGRLVLRGSGDDDLSAAARKVSRRLFGRDIGTGRFDDVFGSHRAPRDVGGVRLAEDRDLNPVERQAFAGSLDCSGIAAEGGVVLHHVLHVLQVHIAVVDGTDLKAFRHGKRLPQNDSPNSSKSIDPDFYPHR